LNYLILTHGAGSNRNAPLLVAVANAFAEAGTEVVRYDLPFRQERPHGPPRPGDAERDREGLREQVLKAREKSPERLWLGGHSYGGRQASILAAENPGLVDGLLLLSYPLHPPRKPAQLRTAHFPKLETPAMFVHGTRDPFGSLDELKAATGLIPSGTRLVEVAGAGHDLGRDASLPARIVEAFLG
jgi:predicted alpha/beta-hydrolase family hydrolase